MCAAFIFYSQPNDFGHFGQFRPLADMIRYGRNDPIRQKLAESARSDVNRCKSKPSRCESEPSRRKLGNPRGRTRPDAAPTRGQQRPSRVPPHQTWVRWLWSRVCASQTKVFFVPITLLVPLALIFLSLPGNF